MFPAPLQGKPGRAAGIGRPHLIDGTLQFASLAPVVIEDLGDTTGSEFVAELASGAIE